MSDRPLSDADKAAMNRKVDLILSMVGKDTDSALTVLAYAMAHVALNAEVTITSLIANLCMIIDLHYIDDEQGEE